MISSDGGGEMGLAIRPAHENKHLTRVGHGIRLDAVFAPPLQHAMLYAVENLMQRRGPVTTSYLS